MIDTETAKFLIGAVTGAGGALVVLSLWVFSLHRREARLDRVLQEKDKTLREKENALLEVATESVGTMKLFLEDRGEQRAHRARVEKALGDMERYLRDH